MHCICVDEPVHTMGGPVHRVKPCQSRISDLPHTKIFVCTLITHVFLHMHSLVHVHMSLCIMPSSNVAGSMILRRDVCFL